MVACPFGAISFFTTLKAIKCDLCDGSPRCVEFCFYDCLQFVELPEQAAADRAKGVRALALKACRHIARNEVRKRQVSFSLEASRVTPTISTEEKNEAIGLDLDSLLRRNSNQ
jgi:Fe-S-cluster-containing dehydrogenase component